MTIWGIIILTNSTIKVSVATTITIISHKKSTYFSRKDIWGKWDPPPQLSHPLSFMAIFILHLDNLFKFSYHKIHVTFSFIICHGWSCFWRPCMKTNEIVTCSSSNEGIWNLTVTGTCEDKNYKQFWNTLVYKAKRFMMTKKSQEKSTYFRRRC